MKTHDPRALMLSRLDVANRLGVSTDFVRACQNATETKAGVRPMTGWVRIGGRFVISEADLLAWISQAPPA